MPWICITVGIALALNEVFRMNKKAVSAVIGVILMVAITVAIAAVVFIYVSGVADYADEKEEIIDFAQGLNWTKYNSACSMLVIDFDGIRDNTNLLVEKRDGWYRLPVVMEKPCTGPWDDRETWAYFNYDTGEYHISIQTGISDYNNEIIAILLEHQATLDNLYEFFQNNYNATG